MKKIVVAKAKASAQGQSIKDPWEKKSKVWALELSTLRSNNLESSLKTWWEKKNRCRQEKQDWRDRRSPENSTNVEAQKIDGSTFETLE